MNTSDELIDRAATGQRSALVRGETSRRIVQQEERVLSMAVANFRNGLLNAEQARDAIAQISALRDFALSLDKDIKRGTAAHAEIASPGPRMGQR